MSVKIDKPIRRNGVLHAVVLELQDPKEVKIYRSFLRSEPIMLSECRQCHKHMDIDKVETKIQVESPLTVGPMASALPIVHCPECGASIDGLSMLDYSIFGDVNAFLQALRAKAAAKKAGAVNGKK